MDAKIRLSGTQQKRVVNTGQRMRVLISSHVIILALISFTNQNFCS